MPAPEGQAREELYTNWVAWATTNLGGTPKLVEAAANAAADTAFRGDGFDAAMKAASAACYATAQADESLWRPSFGSLVLTNPFVWGLLVLLVLIAVSDFSKASSVAVLALLLLPIVLIMVVWQVGVDIVLSLGGRVAHGSLINVTKYYPPRGGVPEYIADYAFDFRGRQRRASHTYYIEDSIRQDVMVLFLPRFPRQSSVLPELVTPGSTSG